MPQNHFKFSFIVEKGGMKKKTSQLVQLFLNKFLYLLHSRTFKHVSVKGCYYGLFFIASMHRNGQQCQMAASNVLDRL